MAAAGHDAAESEVRTAADRLLSATAIKAGHDDGRARGASRVVILLHRLAVHHVEKKLKHIGTNGLAHYYALHLMTLQLPATHIGGSTRIRSAGHDSRVCPAPPTSVPDLVDTVSTIFEETVH